jgi:hypothetical protein
MAIESGSAAASVERSPGRMPVVTLLDLGYSCQLMTLSIFVVDR